MKTIQHWLPLFFWLSVSTLTFILFRSAFSSYFFQDDWFSLYISQAKNFQDFLSFFWPRTSVIYYRPLGMQVSFFLNQVFFGLNPLPFRIETLAIHLLNGYLINRLLTCFLKDKKIIYFGTALYLTASAHMVVFFWAATFAFVLAPTFYLSSFLLYIKNKSKLSWVLFCVGLLTNELLVTLPLVLVIWNIYTKQYKKVKDTFGYWLIIVGYAVFRLTVATFPKSGGYAFLTQVDQLFKNLRNYILWSFNWPEEIQNQFITFFRLNPLFIKDFKLYIAIFLGLTFVYIFVFLVMPLFSLIMSHRLNSRLMNQSIFGFSWFVVTLCPVLFFAGHNFAYYLPIPLFGMLLASLTLFENWVQKFSVKKTAIVLILVFGLWYTAAFENIRFNQFIHWAPRRATLSKTLVNKIKKEYPYLPNSAIVVINPIAVGEETKWAFGEENGLKVLYNDATISTVYGTKVNYLRYLHLNDVENKKIEKRIFEVL